MEKLSYTSTTISPPETKMNGKPLSQLQQNYAAQQALFEMQPPLVQRFLETQAAQLAEAVIDDRPQVRFMLPDRVVCEAADSGEGKVISIPAEARSQSIGGFVNSLTRTDTRTALRLHLLELEQSTNRAVATGAELLRFATVLHMVHNMLPAGRSVTYLAPEGEEIPTLPADDQLEPASAITASTDAIAESETAGEAEEGRGELLVPYVPAARRFYLPKWVAFDDHNQLLVGSLNEAEAHLASMQRYLAILHAAVSLAPYVVADEDYQQKRYGMLGQLVNQGRALARYETGEITRTIQRRAAAHQLNRGLSLSLPYFDDQALEMKLLNFEVVPAGRIMFVPAFVVQASREEQVKVAQDTRLSPSTRKYLLFELKNLEQAFER